MTGKRALSLRYRLDIAARLAAALAGGYGVAALLAIACARALPEMLAVRRIDAVVAGTIAAILVLPTAAMGCFWARSATRAWGGIVMVAALFGGVALAAGWRL